MIVWHLRDADNILVLGEDGTVIEQGSFETLDFESGYVQSLLLGDGQEAKTTSDSGLETSETTKKPVNTASRKSTDSQKDLLRRTGDVQVYKYYFKSIGWKHGTVLVALTLCAEFCLFFPRESHRTANTPAETLT
jgi:ATP-binding cassette subfamily C (CFTR/MRP) protein 1